jgi:2-oxoglutarate dehydrogenase E2 component (dihydrolipoamide succinyltransferase)
LYQQTSIPVPSPGNGIIEERFVEDGTTVKPGDKLFRIKITGERNVLKYNYVREF